MDIFRLLMVLFFITGFNLISRGKELRYENTIYEPTIHSVQLLNSEGSAVPLINLESSERLTLHFDELKSTNDYYQIQVILCDANWNKADFDYNTYCRGMMYGSIDDFKFSQGTYVKYVHYTKTFPSDEFQILWAGNYIVKVYRNFNEDDIILSRRFMVINRKVGISGNVKPATDVQYRFSRQEIDLEVDYTNFTMPDPYNSINLVIQQNNRWNNIIRGIKPRNVANNKLNYNYEDVNLMDGINEWRWFDTRSLRKFTQNIAEKKLDSIWRIKVIPDENRSYLQHIYISDFNGRRIIANKDQGTDGNTDGDYCEMYFSLPFTSQPLGEIYIYGEFSGWEVLPEYKLHWNESKYVMEGKFLLKQGIINYLYAEIKDNKLSFTAIEGNHSETENDYQIWFYYKNPMYGYDELVGSLLLNSGRLGNR